MKSTQKTPPVMMRALTSDVSTAQRVASEYIVEASGQYALLKLYDGEFYSLKETLHDLCSA